MCRISYIIRKRFAKRVDETHSLDNARADSSDGALDPFVARRAHDQRAARINRRQQRIAVFQAMLEVLTGLQRPPDNPCQLAFLERD